MRTVRLGLANACWCLGSVLGLLLSGLLFQSGGEILVFSAALALEVMAFVVSAWRVSFNYMKKFLSKFCRYVYDVCGLKYLLHNKRNFR